MNHVFAALAVAAFGMVVLGGDASAAPAATQAKPAHKQSAPKPAAVKAPSKKAASKANDSITTYTVWLEQARTTLADFTR